MTDQEKWLLEAERNNLKSLLNDSIIPMLTHLYNALGSSLSLDDSQTLAAFRENLTGIESLTPNELSLVAIRGESDDNVKAQFIQLQERLAEIEDILAEGE